MTTRTEVLIATLIAALAIAGCKGRAEPSETELPTLNVTNWTDRTELYMEYPPLVAGHTALFAVHLTTLGDFKPVTAGQARVEFTPVTGGQPTALSGPQPSRPGAFRHASSSRTSITSPTRSPHRANAPASASIT